jgi:ubiquinone/menaquinone biosynthesis C-methylase UbiE
MENNQKKSFLNYEADAWFERNIGTIKGYNSNDDKVLELFKKYNFDKNTILEIGSSAGYRLNALKNTFPESSVFGLEPSEKAIEYGKANYKQVNFTHGTADNLSEYEDVSIDVLIVGFVFYVIDRNILFKVISEIDRVLKNNGVIVIIDFFSETSLKNAYQHIDEFEAYSYKQNYDDIFVSSRLYYLLDTSTYSHSTRNLDASNDYYDKYRISLLKKDINSSYK